MLGCVCMCVCICAHVGMYIRACMFCVYTHVWKQLAWHGTMFAEESKSSKVQDVNKCDIHSEQ